ncbi:MAG: SAM-dependent chlorinase/fluorinase [Flavobacteriales bacterium]
MSVITLISDMGSSDHYLASVKGSILAYAPDAHIVDISHEVRPFDISHAAYLLKSVWQTFPMGSVHVIGVQPELTPQHAHVVVHYMSHYFIGADNGIFSLLFNDLPEDVFEITHIQSNEWNFPMKGVFALAAAHISKGGAPEMLGRRVQEIKVAHGLQPMIEPNLIKGNVVHFDRYGNVHTNIHRSLFESQQGRRAFAITIKSTKNSITKISTEFGEVPAGVTMAVWGHNGYLIIAISKGVDGHGGSARSLHGVKINDTVRIEFNGNSDS